MSITRTVIGTSLTFVRLPADAALRLTGERGAGARLALENLDASARTTIGSVLGDEQLQDDGARMRTAAEERGRAARLRHEAAEQTERAAARAEKRRETTDRRRREARGEAERRREQADRQRNERKSAAARSANQQIEAADRDAAQEKQQADEHAQRDRAESLETVSEALAERDAALTAADESDRLGDAAATAKEQRKG
jgi:hypothetical protein